MKRLVVYALFIAMTIAEPPVDNRYLPPSQGYRTTNPDSFAPPAQAYGPPQRQTDAVFRNRPSFGAPRSQPSNQYGPPNRNQMRQPSSQYGTPSQFGRQNQPSKQYGPPTPSQFGRQNQPSNQYGPPTPSQFGRQNQPSNQYIPPSSAQFGRQNQPSNQYGPPTPAQFGRQNQPSNQYIPPASGQFGRQNQPSNEYGPPSFGTNGPRGQPSVEYGTPQPRTPSQEYGSPNRELGNQYLPPNMRGDYNGDDDSNNEPANYSFEYMVKDDESGNDFGHRESRQGDRAEGLYYVLLPDGRKQTVEYEADQDGYKPKISYEDTGLGQTGGYDGNGQAMGRDNQGQGYQNGQSGPY